MAEGRVNILLSSDDDELIEYVPATTNTNDGLVLPAEGMQPVRPSRFTDRRAPRRIERPTRRSRHTSQQYEQLRRLANPLPGHPPLDSPSEPAVIDLTEEPDSPEEVRATSVPQPTNSGARNPRRTNSQRSSPPRLARSDSTSMAPPPGFGSVIDLTDDTPEEEWGATYLRPRNPVHQHPQHPRDHLSHLHWFGQPTTDSLASLFGGSLGRRLAGITGGLLRHHHAPFAVPHLDVTRNAFTELRPREPSPKPPMEPVPPPREGFTRETCANPPEEENEMVVICPACRDELAYDPTTGTTAPPGTNAGKGKKRRAPGEHHFWAVKRCGHVYCADCFENRRPTKSSAGAGFPIGTPALGATDLRCAVEDCDTKVANKTEWVGIFL